LTHIANALTQSIAVADKPASRRRISFSTDGSVATLCLFFSMLKEGSKNAGTGPDFPATGSKTAVDVKP
jgi:hypothetical protein